MSELPEGWVSCRFEEINFYQSNTIVPSQFGTETFELYSVPSFPTGQPEFVTGQEIGSMKQIVEPGDVLVCKINPRINRVWQVMPKGKYRQIASSEWIVFRSPKFDPRYLRYYFTSSEFRDLICEGVTGVGGSLTRAQPKRVAAFPIPLAPLAEQKRIADKLDALLARVDGCRARLARVPAILKRFRQAVLAAATSGALTADWREEKNSIDSDELRKSIDSLQELPIGWKWIRTNEAGNVQLGRQRAPKYHSGQHMRPYLRVQNVFEARIDLSDVMEMDFPPNDFEAYRLKYGDILLNEGQSPELLGRPAMFRDELKDACFTNTLIRFRAYDQVFRDYALIVFRHYMHCGRFQSEGNITTNIAHLGAGRFANIEFPLPPLAEQHEIVRRVETLFGYADRLEARYTAALTRVERLTPALLAKAFRGELVAQDPADEPAGVLLARVQAARGAVGESPLRRRSVID